MQIYLKPVFFLLTRIRGRFLCWQKRSEIIEIEIYKKNDSSAYLNFDLIKQSLGSSNAEY